MGLKSPTASMKLAMSSCSTVLTISAWSPRVTSAIVFPITWAPWRRDVAAPRRCGPRGAPSAHRAPRASCDGRHLTPRGQLERLQRLLRLLLGGSPQGPVRREELIERLAHELGELLGPHRLAE